LGEPPATRTVAPWCDSVRFGGRRATSGSLSLIPAPAVAPLVRLAGLVRFAPCVSLSQKTPQKFHFFAYSLYLCALRLCSNAADIFGILIAADTHITQLHLNRSTMLQKSYFLLLGLLFAASTTQAQKMDIIDYHKAFLDNTLSPNNQLLSKWQPEWLQEGGKLILKTMVGGTAEKQELSVNTEKTYLTYKDHEGWFGKCYPTFKLYTKADGSQVLGVTEDSYTHHGYRSKYKPEPMSARERRQKGKEACPQYQWFQNPKAIKFWTYKGGTWTEVTNEVMSEFFTLEQMIVKTTPKAQPNVAAYLTEEITFFDGMYPLYRLEPNSNDITVWVDEARLKLFTTEMGAIGDGAEDGSVYSREHNESSAKRFDFIKNTTFKSYTLTWDAKAGKFVRKK
jgi:hypothetical protein